MISHITMIYEKKTIKLIVCHEWKLKYKINIHQDELAFFQNVFIFILFSIIKTIKVCYNQIKSDVSDYSDVTQTVWIVFQTISLCF
jgi:hypothetical protein